MLKSEFEKIAGYEVSHEDYYNIIEPMYYAINLDKTDFVKVINKKRFALKPINKIEKEMREIAKILENTCTHYTDYALKDKLYELASEYTNRIGAKGFIISDKEKQSCYFPYKIDIYDFTFTTVRTIELFVSRETLNMPSNQEWSHLFHIKI